MAHRKQLYGYLDAGGEEQRVMEPLSVISQDFASVLQILRGNARKGRPFD